MSPTKCNRCGATGVQTADGICGNCGDDLREETAAERAEAEFEATQAYRAFRDMQRGGDYYGDLPF